VAGTTLVLARSAEAARNPASALAAIAALRRELDALEARRVEEAVREGLSWAEIAGRLGVTKQAAHRRHAARLRRRQDCPPVREVGEDVRAAVRHARTAAAELGHAVLEPGHLLIGLSAAGGPVGKALAGVGLSPVRLRNRVAALYGPGGEPWRARLAVEEAFRYAARQGAAELCPDHLLAGLLSSGDPGIRKLLRSFRVSAGRIEAALATAPHPLETAN